MLSGFEATGRACRTRSSAQFPLALGTADQFPLAWIHGCFRLWGSVSLVPGRGVKKKMHPTN